MAITFRATINASEAVFYNGSTWAVRANNGTSGDYFSDSSASGHYYSVGSYWKFAGIEFNVGTPLAGSGVTGVWEYATYNTASSFTPVWTALSNVKDDTVGFTVSGTNRVTFDIPTTWENWVNVSSPTNNTNYYVFAVRYRLTGGTMSEGGAQGAATVKVVPQLVLADSGTITPADLYNADVAGTTTLASRSGVTTTDGSPITNIDFVRLCDRSSVGGAANDVAFVLASLTGITSVTVQLAGQDVSGAAQTEDITRTTNGTTYSTKYWKRIDTTQVTAVSGSGSFTYSVTVAKWGVIQKKASNTYVFDANLWLTTTAAFSCILAENLTFNTNYYMHNTSPSGSTFGVLSSGKNAYNIPSFVFNISNGSAFSANYPVFYAANIYGMNFTCNKLATTFNGYSFQVISGTDSTVYNLNVDQVRQIGNADPESALIGAVGKRCHIEPLRGLIAECTIFAGTAGDGIRCTNFTSGQWAHKCDTSGSGSAWDIHAYLMNNSAGSIMNVVDHASWKTLPTNTSRVTFNNNGTAPYTDAVVNEIYSAEIKVIDGSGNPISGAYYDLRQVDGTTQELGLTTNPDGFVGVVYGTASSGAASTLTDSSKSWTTNAYSFREVVITSGTGQGQRRYIKTNTATALTVAPNWKTNPDNTSKYYIVPYVTRRVFTSSSTATGNQPSVITNKGDFTQRIRSYGYKTGKTTQQFNAPVVGAFSLVSDAFIALSQSAAAALTGITVNHSTSTITITENHTLSEVYDYVAQNMLSNMLYDDPLTTTDGINYTSTYNWTINNCTLTGTGKTLNIGSKTLTLSGTGDANFTIVDTSGYHVKINVSGLIANSRVRINNTTDNIELYNAVVSGTSLSVSAIWTVDKDLELKVTNVIGATAYLPFKTKNSTLTNSGTSFTVSQELDTVYNSNGIAGSSITYFSPDYPNIQVDITSGTSFTVQQLYAWYQYTTHSAQGIVYFFDGLIAQDLSNYVIQTSVVELALDNTSGANVLMTGGYLSRDDGTSYIYSLTANSIIPVYDRAYIANSDELLKTDEFLALK